MQPGYLRAIGAASVTVNFVRTLINSGQVPHIKIREGGSMCHGMRSMRGFRLMSAGPGEWNQFKDNF